MFFFSPSNFGYEMENSGHVWLEILLLFSIKNISVYFKIFVKTIVKVFFYFKFQYKSLKIENKMVFSQLIIKIRKKHFLRINRLLFFTN